MNILIHACPQRMWYVNDFLVPMLREQGGEDIEIWNDSETTSEQFAKWFSEVTG